MTIFQLPVDVFSFSYVSRTLLLPAKAMEKSLGAKFSISALFLSRYCLERPARELRSLQLFYLCACLCALCSSTGDSSALSGVVSLFLIVLIPSLV